MIGLDRREVEGVRNERGRTGVIPVTDERGSVMATLQDDGRTGVAARTDRSGIGILRQDEIVSLVLSA